MFRRIITKFNKKLNKANSLRAGSIIAFECVSASARKWRIIAVVLLIAVGCIVGKFALPKSNSITKSSDCIAVFELDGVIETNKNRSKMFKEIKKNQHIKAMLLKINSPGGTITGSEILYNDVKSLAESIPVIALIYDVGASGGYLVALGANKIFVHETSITGSIGVLMQSLDASVLSQKIGATMHTYGSSEFKGQPSPFQKPSKNVEEYLQETINEGMTYFRDTVSARRNLHGKALANIANGKIFTGKQAVRLGLVDGISNEDEVLGILNKMLKEKGVTKDSLLEVEVKVKDDDDFSLFDIIDKLTAKKHKHESRLYAMMNI